MDKSNKVFLDSFVLGIACGFQKCLDVLSHSEADKNTESSRKVPGELQNFLKLSAEVLNYFGEKLEDETNVQSFPFRLILEMVASSSEKIFPAAGSTGVAQEMSVVFEELVQAFKHLINHRSEINLRSSDPIKDAKPSEKTSSATDVSKELCQVLQEMGEILTQIVDNVKADKSTIPSSLFSDISGHASEKTDLTEGNSSSTTEEETLTKKFKDDAKDRTGGAAIVCADNNTDDTIKGNTDVEEHNNEEEVEDKGEEETGSDCDESRSQVDQEETEGEIVVPLLDEGTSKKHICMKGAGEDDTEDDLIAATENDNCVLTEDEEATPQVSKEKELLELSAIRMFREHMDRDGLDMEIFRTPRYQPTKHPSYTCRLLGMEAVAWGRSKRAAKRNALCKMIHLLVKKHQEGCLPEEISPFTNEELGALEEVCLGGDDYLSQLRRLCDLEKAPPPVFDLQISKDSLGEKTFTVKCSALGRSAVGTCSRKRSAKRHAAREIVKQYEQEAASAPAAAEGVQTSA